MSKWIEFRKLKKPSGRKTDIYEIVSKDNQMVLLGHIQWYAPWRCYAFMPNSNCVFEKTCLRDITSFIEELMYARKKAPNHSGALPIIS